MKIAKLRIIFTGVLLLSFSIGNISGNNIFSGGSISDQTGSKSVQTKPKSPQTKPKSSQTKPKSAQTGSKQGTKSVGTRPKPAPVNSKSPVNNKGRDSGTIMIGSQLWAAANLDVSKFQNGDSIPEAKTNKEWVAAGEAGKPAWCYYNNDPANAKKYGKLYNWFAISDPRGLAPAGWTLATDEDWARLMFYLGGQTVAGNKLKNSNGWLDDYNGTNESGFSGMPGGYRVENGIFLNLGSIGTWWSSTAAKSLNAFDFYLAQSGSLTRGSSPRQRGESVRCIRK